MTFTLASFNICSAHFREGHYTDENLCALADKLRESRADVAALQEVDVGAARSDRVDMPARLADMAGFPYRYFIKIRDFQGGQYGTAILSRYPIKESRTIDFPVRIATQGTSCGYIVLDYFGTDVTVFNTHLSVESDEANTECMTCLSDILRGYTDAHPGPVLCCGDFNEQPPKVARLIPFMKRAHDGLITYGSVSIDHILYLNCTVAAARTKGTQSDRTTDHDMLLAEVTPVTLFAGDSAIGRLEALLGTGFDFGSLMSEAVSEAPEPAPGAFDFGDVLERLECFMDGYDSTAEGMDAMDPAQRTVYAAAVFSLEWNNGGLCQYLVNTSRETAPYLDDALHTLGAEDHRALVAAFFRDNGLDPNDLSDWRITDVSDYGRMEGRLPFRAFDDALSALPDLDDVIEAYAREHEEEINGNESEE